MRLNRLVAGAMVCAAAAANAEPPPAAGRSESVKAMLSRLQRPPADRPAIGTLTAASRPAGQLLKPAPGRIERRWGQTTEAGPATGILFRVLGPAQVVSPCTGGLEFAEVFRSYGLLLIIDCGGGYHVVLSGFDRLDARAGQTVRKGEPVGAVTSSGGAGVHLELRRNGQPLNPAPWLRTGR